MVANFFRLCLSLSPKAQYYRDIDKPACRIFLFLLTLPEGGARHQQNENQAVPPVLLPFALYLLPLPFSF
jgi:hypothetical protein